MMDYHHAGQKKVKHQLLCLFLRVIGNVDP